LGIKEHCRFRKIQFVFVFWTEEVAAICHAVVVELAGRPSLGNDLKMTAIRKEFRASEESRYHYSFVVIEASVGHLLAKFCPVLHNLFLA